MRIENVRATLVVALFGALVSTAVAQPADPATDPDYQLPKFSKAEDRAREYNVRARKAYDLGKFQKAVDLYTKAYEELPDGAFLFNIAQSYRQLDNCKQALFFYRRFLSVKKDAPAATRKEVEGHIVVLEECVKKQDDIRRRPPDDIRTPDIGDGEPNPPPPDGTGGTTTGGTTTGTTTGGTTTGTTTGGTTTGTTTGGTTTGTTTGGTTTGGTDAATPGDTGGDRVGAVEPPPDGDDGDLDAPVTPAGRTAPRLVVARLLVGGAAPSFGSLPVDVPVQASFALGAGYPLALGPKLVLDVGPTIALTPVPWTGMAGASGKASLIEVVGDVGATYAVASKIDVRAEVGGGVLMFIGLDEGNPFTVGGAGTTGALTMPHFRGGLTGTYRVSSKLGVSLSPIAFGYSPPKSGLRDEVGSLTQLQFTVGVTFQQ